MTKYGNFKKVIRHHPRDTGQRYTEALADLQGPGARMHHEPAAEGLLAHLQDRYGIDPIAVTKLSMHKTYVSRIDRSDGDRGSHEPFRPLAPGQVSRATPQSCGSRGAPLVVTVGRLT